MLWLGTLLGIRFVFELDIGLDLMLGTALVVFLRLVSELEVCLGLRLGLGLSSGLEHC